MVSSPTAVLELPHDASAPSAARRFLGDHSQGCAADMIDDAQLLASELVTNAVRHGIDAVTITIALDEGVLRVSVDDCGQDFVHSMPTVPDLVTASGRGLMIVAAIAVDWGVSPCDPGPGKSVWFVLDSADYDESSRH